MSLIAEQDQSWVGQVTPVDINSSKLCEQAEQTQKHGVARVYFYFSRDYDVSGDAHGFKGGIAFDLIDRLKILWGLAYCMSTSELRASLKTNDPHYGDGVYMTCHEDLDRAAPAVRKAHGERVAERTTRAVYEVVDTGRLRKYRGTAGVMRWVPDFDPVQNQKITLEAQGKTLLYLRTERLDRGRWVEVRRREFHATRRRPIRRLQG